MPNNTAFVATLMPLKAICQSFGPAFASVQFVFLRQNSGVVIIYTFSQTSIHHAQNTANIPVAIVYNVMSSLVLYQVFLFELHALANDALDVV